ncbi:MAG: dioxygenase [Planctomycetes bacterium]|nr:dioxygenase [Planctomycetota bacterium]
MASPVRLPATYLAHGSPMLAVERDGVTEMLSRWGGALRPRTIVVVSAHWEARGAVRVTGSPRPPLIYDFSGFPPELYDLRYPSPGDPALAAEIVKRLEESGLKAALDGSRGLDHGAWVPLLHAFPAASLPVVEVSLPVPRTPEEGVQVGRALAPLRDRGVLLVGSGGIVHNLRRVRFDDKQAPEEDWAKEFDGWIRDRVKTLDAAAIAAYRKDAPHASEAVPTSEHFDPIFFVLGAALPGDRVSTLFEGFHYGNLSMRSFELQS